MLAWPKSALEPSLLEGGQLNISVSSTLQKLKLSYLPKRGIKTLCYSCYHLEREGNITHLQMRFNLVNNVTWPLFWHLPVFSYVQASSLGLQKLFR